MMYKTSYHQVFNLEMVLGVHSTMMVSRKWISQNELLWYVVELALVHHYVHCRLYNVIEQSVLAEVVESKTSEVTDPGFAVGEASQMGPLFNAKMHEWI